MDELMSWLKHPDPRIRMIATEGLARMDKTVGISDGAIVAQLMDPNALVRKHAHEVLVKEKEIHAETVARGVQKHVDLEALSHHAEARVKRELAEDLSNIQSLCAATLGHMGEA